MPTYEIQAPDGKTYTIEGDNEQGAIEFLKGHLEGQTAATPPAPTQESMDGQAQNLATYLSFLTTTPQKDMSPTDQAEITANQAAETRDMRRSEFNNLPVMSKIGQAADDTMRLIADGASFGFGDKLAAYMNSGGDLSYEDALAAERDLTQAARDRAGSAGTAATIGGAVMPASMVAKAGLTPFRLAPGAGAPILTQMAGGAAAGGIEGAAYGALDALGHDQDVNQGAWAGSIGGTMGGGAAPAIAAGASRLAGYAGDIWSSLTGKGPAPRMTADQVGAAAKTAYDDVENMGVTIRPDALKNLAQGIEDSTNAARLRDARVNPSARPVRDATVKELRKSPGMSLSDLDAERAWVDRSIVDPIGGGNKEGRFAGIIQNEIDDFTKSLTPRDIRAAQGVDPAAANARLLEARELSSRSKKLADFEGILSKADRRAASSRSGDLRTPVNTQINSILDKIESGRIPAGRYTPDEVAKMNQVVYGTRLGNAAGKVADITGGKIGVGAGSMIGGTLTGGNPVGAIVGGALPFGVSKAARSISNRSTDKATQELLDLIASGGSAPQITKNAAQAIAERSPEDIARLLMLYSLAGQD